MDQQKQLFHAVHPYGENNNFLLWYSRFVSVMMGFGLYVPPAQTMRDGDPLGIDFPSSVQPQQLSLPAQTVCPMIFAFLVWLSVLAVDFWVVVMSPPLLTTQPLTSWLWR